MPLLHDGNMYFLVTVFWCNLLFPWLLVLYCRVDEITQFLVTTMFYCARGGFYGRTCVYDFEYMEELLYVFQLIVTLLLI